MPFHARLREERERLGLKQEDLAEVLGIGRSALSHYERGEREPDHGTLLNMARRFGVTTDYLLCRTDDRLVFVEVPEDWREFIQEHQQKGMTPAQIAKAIRTIEDFLALRRQP